MAKTQVATTSYNVMKAIATSDTVSIASGVTDAIIITAAGNAVLIDPDGNLTTHTAIPVGTVIPVKVIRVNATGTTATAAALYY